MALFIKGWSIPESTEAFKRLAEVAFQKRNVLRLPLLSRLQRYLISYLSDSIYPAENIELVLKEVFGIETNILDYSHATSIGTRIGLPVASVSNPPGHHVFTNYNGAGERDKRLGKYLAIFTWLSPEIYR